MADTLCRLGRSGRALAWRGLARLGKAWLGEAGDTQLNHDVDITVDGM